MVGVFLVAGGRVVIRSRGHRRAGEVRDVGVPGGSVTVIGQCFADDGGLRRAAVQALRSGDIDALTRLPGAYACLLHRDGEVTLAEDVAGQYPFYYRYDGRQLWFSDRPARVAEAAGVQPRPDTVFLAARILCPQVPPLTGDGSPVEGVRRLGAGHALRVGTRSGLRRWAYEPLPSAALPTRARRAGADEAAEAVREALDEAVGVRAARDRLTSDLSGGLDSTSLAFLALAHQPGDLAVFVYHHPEFPSEDLTYARQHARLDPRLRLETVAGGPGELTFQGLDLNGFPYDLEPGTATRARTRLRLRRIAARGGGPHLGGEGGDALFTAPPAYLADLARLGALRRLRGDSWTLARQRHVSPAAVMAAAARLSRTSMTTALERLADRLERPAERDVGWLDGISWWPDPGREALWLTRSARSALAERARHAAATAKDRPPVSAADLWTRCELAASAAMQRHLSDCAREFGVWPQAPFLDHTVIRAALSLPAHLRAAPPAFKPLLTRALAGVVPREVLARRTKGDYSVEDYTGARGASAALRSLLASSRLAELGVIEPASVLASLDRAALGVGAPFAALTRLLGAEAGLWAASNSRRGPFP